MNLTGVNRKAKAPPKHSSKLGSKRRLVSLQVKALARVAEAPLLGGKADEGLVEYKGQGLKEEGHVCFKG